jgi:hypothetical protein
MGANVHGVQNLLHWACALCLMASKPGEVIMLWSQGFIVWVGILSSCLVPLRSPFAKEPALRVGQLAPTFTCWDSDGKRWNSQDFLGNQILVVYFYPSDFDFCSTRQAEHYQEQLRN